MPADVYQGVDGLGAGKFKSQQAKRARVIFLIMVSGQLKTGQICTWLTINVLEKKIRC
jgi:hypothetical protein